MLFASGITTFAGFAGRYDEASFQAIPVLLLPELKEGNRRTTKNRLIVEPNNGKNCQQQTQARITNIESITAVPFGQANIIND